MTENNNTEMKRLWSDAMDDEESKVKETAIEISDLSQEIRPACNVYGLLLIYGNDADSMEDLYNKITSLEIPSLLGLTPEEFYLNINFLKKNGVCYESDGFTVFGYEEKSFVFDSSKRIVSHEKEDSNMPYKKVSVNVDIPTLETCIAIMCFVFDIMNNDVIFELIRPLPFVEGLTQKEVDINIQWLCEKEIISRHPKNFNKIKVNPEGKTCTLSLEKRDKYIKDKKLKFTELEPKTEKKVATVSNASYAKAASSSSSSSSPPASSPVVNNKKAPVEKEKSMTSSQNKNVYVPKFELENGYQVPFFKNLALLYKSSQEDGNKVKNWINEMKNIVDICNKKTINATPVLRLVPIKSVGGFIVKFNLMKVDENDQYKERDFAILSRTEGKQFEEALVDYDEREKDKILKHFEKPEYTDYSDFATYESLKEDEIKAEEKPTAVLRVAADSATLIFCIKGRAFRSIFMKADAAYPNEDIYMTVFRYYVLNKRFKFSTIRGLILKTFQDHKIEAV